MLGQSRHTHARNLETFENPGLEGEWNPPRDEKYLILGVKDRSCSVDTARRCHTLQLPMQISLQFWKFNIFEFPLFSNTGAKFEVTRTLSSSGVLVFGPSRVAGPSFFGGCGGWGGCILGYPT